MRWGRQGAGPRAVPAVPSISCPDVWEGPPYLNRYDHYVDNGSGQCVPGSGYDIFATTITNTVTLIAGNNYLESQVSVALGGQLIVPAGASVLASNPCCGPQAIYVAGTLTMNGTASQPISLTSGNATPSPGNWGGVAYWPGGSGTLNHVHLSYAGANMNDSPTQCCVNVGLEINGASVSVSNTTIDNSSGNGLELGGPATPTLAAIALNNNAGWAVQYDFLPASGVLNDPSIFSGSGNGHNGVRVTVGGSVSGSLGLGAGALSQAEFDAPLTLLSGAQFTLAAGPITSQYISNCGGGGVTVNAGAQMNVGAGNTLQFNGCNRLGGLAASGTLNLDGTASQPITLTSGNSTPAPGDWEGVAYWPGSSGALSNVHLSYAGASMSSSPTSCCVNTAIEVNNASPSISFVTIDNSNGNDVEVTGGGLPVMHNDSFGPVSGGRFGVVNDNGASGPTVDATQDWWGDPSGPSGPGGTGLGVPVSLGVDFTPWLGAPPFAANLASSVTHGGYFDPVVVTATNFAPFEPVTVYWDGTGTTPLGSGTAGAMGTAVISLTVPQAISGTHTLIATGALSFKSASTPFTVTTKTYLFHRSGAQGSFNIIDGYGFASFEPVRVYWGSTRGPLLATSSTDVLGTFAGPISSHFTVPISPTGTYAVIAVGQSSHDVGVISFTVLPTLSIFPTSGLPGAHAAVAGTGFGANETVTVKWDCASVGCSSTTVLGTAQSNANGDFSGLSVTIPTGVPTGAHTIGGQGSRTRAFATVTFTVT